MAEAQHRGLAVFVRLTQLLVVIYIIGWLLDYFGVV